MLHALQQNISSVFSVYKTIYTTRVQTKKAPFSAVLYLKEYLLRLSSSRSVQNIGRRVVSIWHDRWQCLSRRSSQHPVCPNLLSGCLAISSLVFQPSSCHLLVSILRPDWLVWLSGVAESQRIIELFTWDFPHKPYYCSVDVAGENRMRVMTTAIKLRKCLTFKHSDWGRSLTFYTETQECRQRLKTDSANNRRQWVVTKIFGVWVVMGLHWGLDQNCGSAPADKSNCTRRR